MWNEPEPIYLNKGKTKLKIQKIVSPDDYDIDLAAIVADAAIM